MAIEAIGDLRKAGTPEISSLVFSIPQYTFCRLPISSETSGRQAEPKVLLSQKHWKTLKTGGTAPISISSRKAFLYP